MYGECITRYISPVSLFFVPSPIKSRISSIHELPVLILNNTGKLIKDSMSYIDEIGEYVSAAPDSRDVEALAKLISSSSTALDSLQKMHISNEKNKNAVFIKTLDIESKKVLQQTDQDHKLLLNREELMSKLILEADIVEDVESITTRD